MTSRPREIRTAIRRSWVLGGALLLAGVLLPLALQQTPALLAAAGLIGAVLNAAALAVFAIGLHWAASVTARRPLGTGALLALAAWGLGWPYLSDALGAGSTGAQVETPLLVLGYVDLVVRLALATVAVVQIGRAGVVPAPWRWAPGWALLAVVLAGVVGAVVALGRPEQELAVAWVSVEQLVRVAATVFLGVLAIVLGGRTATRTRIVVDPSPDDLSR